MRLTSGARLLAALALWSLIEPAALKAASPVNEGVNSAAPLTVEAQLETVHDLRQRNKGGRSRALLIEAHHTLLGLYWRQVASDRVASLPPVTLMGSNGRFSGCGQARSVNAYCPESNEIILSTRGMKRTQRFSKAKRHLLDLAVLAHEWGHHVNHNSTRGRFKHREEDAADWRAGRYLAWLMQKEALGVKEFTDAANLFFSIGDFHFHSPHNNPKARYQAFIAGVGDELNPGLRIGAWNMDTPETFSRLNDQQATNKPRSESQSGPATVTAEVYRFEIERGGQIAGNLFSAVLGVIECSSGSSEGCANSLLRQGQAKPEGWYRLRTMSINCERGDFDIENDGIQRQPWERDRKGQAAVIAERACQQKEASDR